MDSSKIVLTGLKAHHFRHPLDLEATQALQQIPGLDILIRSVLGSVGEQFFQLENLASGVQVSEKQLPHLHELLLDACKILELEPPQLFVKQNPAPNAYTFAMRGQQPFIVLHTSLIDMLTPEEIQAVIAHELGHLKCEHSVYLTLANLLILAASTTVLGSIAVQTLQERMMEWVRCAEFTCDRAALLVTQNPRTVASLLMKLCGGSPALAPILNLDAFLEQARAYENLSTSEIGRVLRQAQTAQLTHPVPVLRAKEVDRWATSSDYENLLQRRTILYNKEVEPKGGWRNW